MVPTDHYMKFTTLIICMLFLSRLASGQGGSREVIICSGTTVRLQAKSADAFGYQWVKDNEIIPGFSGQELVISQEGNYSAYALNSDGCVSGQSVVIILGFRRPEAVDDFETGKMDTPQLLDVLKNDQAVCTELDDKSLVVKVQPVHGIVTKQNDIFLYTPAPGFSNVDLFTYSVRDKTGQESNIATVTIDLIKPLPVKLLTFDAEKKENAALLTWTTAEEINSREFLVQRSNDSKNWVGIGSVQSAVNTSEKRSYEFLDNLPESGTNYYRLKMIDQDETFAYSKIKAVHFPEFSWARLYPNPVSHLLHINIRNSQVRKLRLIDVSGRILLRSDVVSKELTMDMHDYKPGIYFVHLEQENGLVAVFKVAHN